MRSYLYACAFLTTVLLTGCAQDFEVVHFQKPEEPSPIVTTMPVPQITINVNNNTSVQTGSNTLSGGNATGGSNTNSNTSSGGSAFNSNQISSGNATGGTGGSSSAGNATANNSGSSNSTNSSTNSGSASNQANNSTNNSSDNSNQVSQTNNQSQVVDEDSSYTRTRLPNKGKKKHTKHHSCNKDKTSPGLSCKVYDLRALVPNSMPNYSSMTPVATIEVDQFDVSDTDYANSFPKFPNSLKYLVENYGLSCSGYLDIPSTGSYTFYLTSDDGSKLYINNALVIDNDGLHSTRAYSNTVNLTKGKQLIKLDYFQGPRTRISLVLEYSYGAYTRALVPTMVLSH